jgi:hypothetical protein
LLRRPPVILVTDCTQEPQITSHYFNGSNEIDFEQVYKTIKKDLFRFKPCTHRPSTDSWPCRACTNAFLKIFWWCAARILDYFADFIQHDTAMMGSVWFHLLDVFQESSLYFPTKAILKNPPQSTPAAIHDFFSNNEFSTILGYRNAYWFWGNFGQTLDLMKHVLDGPEEESKNCGPMDDIIHPPDGDVMALTGDYNTGPWQSGLTPWEQFLHIDSQGVDGFEDLEKKAEGGVVRYLPMGAIGIIKTHTDRLREIARKISPDPEFLHRFEKSCLVFPQSVNDPPASYRTSGGKEMVYKLVNGAPPIVRSGGYPDTEMEIPDETFTMLDDAVGLLRGIKAYKPLSGDPRDDDDDDDDENDEDDEYPDDAFDMWAIYEPKKSPDDTKSHKAAKA